MATRGTPIKSDLIRSIRQARDAHGIRAASRETQTSRNTVRKYTRPPKSD